MKSRQRRRAKEIRANGGVRNPYGWRKTLAAVVRTAASEAAAAKEKR